MTRAIRVLHALGWVGSGGVEQRRLLLAKGLSRSKYDHAIVCQEASGGLPGSLSAYGWKIEEIGYPRNILDPVWYRRALQVAREFSPDVIHGAVFEGVALANVLGCFFPNVPVISEETSYPTNRRWGGRLLTRTFHQRSQVVIGVSPSVIRYLTDVAKVPPRKAILIDNAVAEYSQPSQTVQNVLRAQLGIRSDNIVVGSVGRLYDNPKRFSDLIAAFGAIGSEIPSARLLIVGDGPDRSTLEDQASSLGLADRIVFAGYQADTRPFYSLMDVFVLASDRESFGLVLVEAMLAGVPVVATAVGGIPHVLGDGAAGVLVPPRDPSALARAIVGLLRDPDVSSRFCTAALERARTYFSAERYCAEIDGLYQRLASPLGRT